MLKLVKTDEDKVREEARTIAMVDKLFSEAKKYREEKASEDKWDECQDFYKGKHWKNQNRSYKNLILPVVETQVALLSDNLPGTDFLARKVERDEDAKILESAVHSVYEDQNLPIKLSQAQRASLITGTGFIYVDFDPDGDSGQGRVTHKNMSKDHVYLDPAASDLDEAHFVGIKFPIRISEVERKFPEFKGQIKPFSGDDQKNESRFMGREDRANAGSGSSNDDKYKLDGMTVLEEAWIRDFSMVAIPEEETAKEIEKETEEFFNDINPDIGRFEDHGKHIEAHEGQKRAIAAEALQMPLELVTDEDIENLKADPELGLKILVIEDHIKIHKQYFETNQKGEKPKFTSGMRLVMKTGKTILYDGSAPVDDGMVPLVPFYCYKDEDSVWGVGEVKNLLPSQKSFNEMDNAEYESLKLTSNPGWVMDANCGINPNSITNQIGKVYIKNPGTEFRRLEPGTTSPQLLTRKQTDHQSMKDISGVNDASVGNVAGGVTAAKAIERLQSQANGRLRLKASYTALYSMPRLGKLTASRVCKYYTTERLMRISDADSGAYKSVIFDPERVKDLDYDVRVVPGTMAGTDKEALFGLMNSFVEKGMITPKMFFKSVDVPFKRKILEEIEANDQQTMLLEQLAAENEQLKAQLGLTNNAEATQSVPVTEGAQAQEMPQAF